MFATRFAISFVVLIFVSAGGSEAIAQQKERSLIEICVTGDGYQRGLAHGKQLKAEIAEIVAKWKENTSRGLNQDADKVLKEFFEYAEFEPAIKKWTPSLFEEVKGIAEGSGQPFESSFVLNLLDEFWVYIDELNHHCSALGIPAHDGNPARVA